MVFGVERWRLAKRASFARCGRHYNPDIWMNT
jgi:hypothetical protein